MKKKTQKQKIAVTKKKKAKFAEIKKQQLEDTVKIIRTSMDKEQNRKEEEQNRTSEDTIFRVLTNYTHRDLQRECILRGMPFDDVVKLDHMGLVSWFYRNYDNPTNEVLLKEYDAHIILKLKEAGWEDDDAIMSPLLRFSYKAELPEVPQPVKKVETSRVQAEKPNKANIPKSEKKPTEVDKETGVRKGTKKNLTYTLAKQKIPLEKVVKQVMKEFPEAQEKSIKIWYKRAIK